jgi:LL-diaminopimelate aminotransferase
MKKRELVARGVDVIDLGVGDADLSPPPKAIEALKRAVDQPAMSRYGFALGLPAYREAIAKWMRRRFGVIFDPYTEVVPLIGSKEGIAHLAMAYVGPGDVTIIPEPGYLAYLGGTLLGDGEAYTVPLRRER